MPSSIWTGAISFGLVQVPVKLVGATKSKDVSFNQLEKGTGARIRYRKVSDKTGEEVSADRIERGFEVSKGKYVIVEQSEIETLRPKGSHEIEIEEFVDLDDIDPLYFEQPYYLVPDKLGEKPYALLVDAMQSLNKVAIGRVVMRNKEHLVAIRPMDGVLCVEMMRWSDEIVEHDGLVEDSGVELSERELTMAKQLIEALSSPFEPSQYHDEYREQLLDLIERKAAGEQIVAEPVAEESGKVLDLMAALRASLEKSGRDGGESSDAAADDEGDNAPAKKPAAKKAAAKKATTKSGAEKKPAAKKPAAKRRTA